MTLSLWTTIFMFRGKQSRKVLFLENHDMMVDMCIRVTHEKRLAVVCVMSAGGNDVLFVP